MAGDELLKDYSSVLEGIANKANTRESLIEGRFADPSNVEIIIDDLLNQGLIVRSDKKLQINGELPDIVTGTKQMRKYMQEKLRVAEIAMGCAILKYSSPKAKVQNVLSYIPLDEFGRQTKAYLVVLHQSKSGMVKEFYSRDAHDDALSLSLTDDALYDLSAETPGSTRLESNIIIRQLMNRQENRQLMVQMNNIARNFGKRAISKDTYEAELDAVNGDKYKVLAHVDCYGFYKLLDLHCMHTRLMNDPQAIKQYSDQEFIGIIASEDSVRNQITKEMNEERAEIIQHCLNPHFWQQTLELGNLFNIRTSKFDINVNDKYPESVDLFEPTQYNL